MVLYVCMYMYFVCESSTWLESYVIIVLCSRQFNYALIIMRYK